MKLSRNYLYKHTMEGKERNAIYNKSSKGKAVKKKADVKWRLHNPEKRHAHKIVEHAVAHGLLYPRGCEMCMSKKCHAHHEDYSKPLEVIWLCNPCHKQWHKEEQQRDTP